MEAKDLQDRLQKLATPLDIEAKRNHLLTLRTESMQPDFWSDQARAVAVSAEVAGIETLLRDFDDTSQMLSMAEELSENDLTILAAEVERLERLALLSGPHDQAGAILTIHAGTGGTDAQDFAEMLKRMYLRFVEQGKTEAAEERIFSLDRRSWKAEILDESRGEEAGIKRVSMQIAGRYAYGLLRSEAGVHRLVRQSPFNAKGLRQTSFALVEVIPQLEQKDAPTIDEKDLKIDIFRASGAGGQHVNTTDSAVRITHIPTGIVVTVQNERSQHQNKAKALAVLSSKLALLQELKNAEEVAMLKGEVKEGSWGNQIRSYVLHPYQMIKDHRTNAETSATTDVLDGELKHFIEAYLTNQ